MVGRKPDGTGHKTEPQADLEGMRTIGEDDLGYTERSLGLRRLAAGEVFAGRYAIEALVGEGGSGSIYKAFDRLTDQTVALKLIRTDRLDTAEARARLVREAITARDIRHPNVIAVYDASESDGQPYLTMEHLPGQSLRAWSHEQLASGAECPFPTAQAIIAAILDGLEAAHAQGVIHRDLKPENVFLIASPDGAMVKLKLLDFGIARAAGPAGLSSSGSGMPWYWAPEQITAPESAAPSADLYSLSVMFYELLVGVLPQGPWQPPSLGRADTPQAVDRLIEAGLSNRPRLRPQSTSEYREALLAAMEASAPPLGASTRKAPTAARVDTGQPEPADIRALADAIMRESAGDEARLAEARALYLQAALQGDGPSMAAAGFMLENGFGGPPNETAGKAWIEKAMDAGVDVAEVIARLSEWFVGDPDAPVADADVVADPRALRREADRLVRTAAGDEKKIAQARALYLEAAQLGDAAAMASIYFFMSNGFGGSEDKVEGENWFNKAMDLDVDLAEVVNRLSEWLTADPDAPPPPAPTETEEVPADAGQTTEAIRKRASMLYDEGATPAALTEARKLYRICAERGDGMGMRMYGLMLANGQGGAKDDATAREWFRKGSDIDEPGCLNNYGIFLAEGRGGPADPKLAMFFYRRAAERGDGLAMFNLGLGYANGEGAAKDPSLARHWYQKSAEAGNAKGMYNYGDNLVFGRGGKKDEPAGREWLRKGAEKGNRSAMFIYSLVLSDGLGGPRDAGAARTWRLKAAELGDELAMHHYALLLEKGQGGPKDLPGARVWFARSADAGHPKAAVKLAQMMLVGAGGPKDKAVAKSLLQKAAAQGEDEARDLLTRL